MHLLVTHTKSIHIKTGIFKTNKAVLIKLFTQIFEDCLIVKLDSKTT